MTIARGSAGKLLTLISYTCATTSSAKVHWSGLGGGPFLLALGISLYMPSQFRQPSHPFKKKIKIAFKQSVNQIHKQGTK